MRITDLKIHVLKSALAEPFAFSQGWVRQRSATLVEVVTDAGITGWGEAFAQGLEPPEIAAIVIDKALRPILIGADPLDTEVLWHRMYSMTRDYGRKGSVVSGISAVDIALWDIRGKVLGKPLSELLGSKRRDRILAYGTVYPLGNTPDEVRRTIDRGLKLGLKAIKIVADPFWRNDLEHTKSLIRAARAHVGPDIKLMVDAATAWSCAEDGLPLMPIFREYDFQWVEAPLPVDDLSGHARFQGYGVPIGGGDLGLTTRFEYEQMFDIGKIDIAQPDVTMAGGLTELLRIARMARARSKRVVTHGYKSNITIAANLAFLAQHWDEEPLEYSTSLSPLRWHLTNEHFEIGDDGKVEVPLRPGLGVSINPETVEKYRVR
jgi:L-rhamnonate dehydratase